MTRIDGRVGPPPTDDALLREVARTSYMAGSGDVSPETLHDDLDAIIRRGRFGDGS